MCKEASEGGVPTLTQLAALLRKALFSAPGPFRNLPEQLTVRQSQKETPKAREDAGSSLRAADSHWTLHRHVQLVLQGSRTKQTSIQPGR